MDGMGERGLEKRLEPKAMQTSGLENTSWILVGLLFLLFFFVTNNYLVIDVRNEMTRECDNTRGLSHEKRIPVLFIYLLSTNNYLLVDAYGTGWKGCNIRTRDGWDGRKGARDVFFYLLLSIY